MRSRTTQPGSGAPQLTRLIQLAAEAEARPGVAALEGEFDQDLAGLLTQAGGGVLSRDELLTRRARR
jgi:hypothetical protein